PRTSSADPRCSAVHSVLRAKPSSATADNSEVEKLKREITLLREELYMKVGELSSLKEASSRSTSSRLELIRKLEAQLAAEREENRKTVSALNSQLAFREADYQLVANELAQVKEVFLSSQANQTEHMEVATAASPASALLASVIDDYSSKDAEFKTPRRVAACRMPTSVSPVMSRATPSKRRRLWNDEIPSTATSSPSRTVTRQGVRVIPLKLPPTPFAPPQEGEEEEAAGSAQATPCKRTQAVDDGDAVPQKTPPRLRYRLRSGKTGDRTVDNVVLGRIAGDLSRLSMNTGSLLRFPEMPIRNFDEGGEADPVSADREFFEGLSILTLTAVECDDAVGRLGQSIPLLLPQIRNRLREYIKFFLHYRLGTFDRSFSHSRPNTSYLRLSESMTSGGNSANNSFLEGAAELVLNEDPFAGAPASQVVPVPSLSIGKPKMAKASSSPPTAEGFASDPNSWLETAANHAIDGTLACLRQLSVLLNYSQDEDVDIGGLALIVCETINDFAKLLSTAPTQEDRELNDIPARWMSRLANVIQVTLFVASSVASELGKRSDGKMPDASHWPPSILGVLLLALHALSSDSAARHSPLSPTLRLITHLIEGGQLPLLEHAFVQSSASHWWNIGDLEPHSVGLELLARLQDLHVAPARERHEGASFMRSWMTSTNSLNSDSPQDRLGCPLLLLCKIVKSEGVQTNESDIERCCSLLAEFAKFTSTLVTDSQSTRSTSCACTLEMYSTLIGLGVIPVDWLFRQSEKSSRLNDVCLSALGCLTQALQSLLLAHGDRDFQAYTDRVPAFFSIISRLSRWSRLKTDTAHLIHPQLVEELYDFDNPQVVAGPSTTN
ncbi:unnamed protein product, partial [Mesocestoides corti]